MRRRDKGKIRAYRRDCVIRGARRCVASAPLFAIIPRLFFSRTRALVSLVLNSDRRTASSLSSFSVPSSLRRLAFLETPTAFMVPLDLSPWRKCRWRNWSSSYSLIRIETKGHILLVGGFTNRARHWPDAARTRIRSRCACWAWRFHCCVVSRCRPRCYQGFHRTLSPGCWLTPGAEAYDVSQSFGMCLHRKISLGVLLKFTLHIDL